MPYVKQHAIATGQPAQAGEVNENFEDARRYINKDIVQADLANDSVDYPEIVRGELNAGTQQHQFTAGNSMGNFVDRQSRNINPFTRYTKKETTSLWTDQRNAASAPLTTRPLSQILQLPDNQFSFEMEQRGLVTLRTWIEVIIPATPCNDPEDNTVKCEHRYTTYMYLSDDGGETTMEDTTKGKFYDYSEFSGGGGGGSPSSWAGPPNQDPMKTVADTGWAANIPWSAYNRFYCITRTKIMNAGTHQFGVVYDAHHDVGYAYVCNTTVEIEYIGSNIT